MMEKPLSQLDDLHISLYGVADPLPWVSDVLLSFRPATIAEAEASSDNGTDEGVVSYLLYTHKCSYSYSSSLNWLCLPISATLLAIFFSLCLCFRFIWGLSVLIRVPLEKEGVGILRDQILQS